MTMPTPEFWVLVAAVSASTMLAVYMAARPARTAEDDDVVLIMPPMDPEEAEEIAMATTEDAYGQGILPLQIKAHPELVERLRAKARELAAKGREISSDDIHDAIRIPDGVDPRIMGAVFYPKTDWMRTGWKKSRRKENHGRPIACWVLRESLAA